MVDAAGLLTAGSAEVPQDQQAGQEVRPSSRGELEAQLIHKGIEELKIAAFE